MHGGAKQIGSDFPDHKVSGLQENFTKPNKSDCKALGKI